VNVGYIDAREERVAVIKARHNETKDKFDSCVGRKMFSDKTDAAKVVVTSFGSCGDKTFHGEGGIEVDTKILGRVRN